MITKTLRAFATAFILAAGATVLLGTSGADAATVRPQVGAALKAAISDASEGNGGAALAKVREAESQPNLTPQEQQAIEQTKNYVSAKTGAGGGALGCKAKFANDYNGGRYNAVVGDDAECLRKSGGLSGDDELIIAQAYYLSHDYNSCLRQLKAIHVSEKTLTLYMRCAYETHEEQLMQGALEELVVTFNQPKWWSDLLDSANRTQGLSNSDSLDIYRLRLLTGTMKNASDYETATEIAIQLGFPTEAETFAQKGVDAKLLPADRGARLLTMAKTNAAGDMAGLTKAEAAAASAKSGDADVKIGEDLWGMGRYQDALNIIKAGIAKGVSNPDEAQTRLGMAYIGLRQRDNAMHALSQVSKTAPPHTQLIAKLWSIYAKTH